MKKIIINFLLIVFISFPIIAQNANDFETRIETADSSQSILITGYTGTAKDIVIPERINGILVTGIGYETFKDKMLTSVIFPSGINFIGSNAFRNNRLTHIDLSHLELSQGIGSWAFANNLLTNVIIPRGITLLEGETFYDNKLTGITLPDTITYLGVQTFAKNPIRQIRIGSNVRLGNEEYGWYSFTDVAYDENRNRFYHVESNLFETYYIGNGRKAGVYTLNANGWSYSPN